MTILGGYFDNGFLENTPASNLPQFPIIFLIFDKTSHHQSEERPGCDDATNAHNYNRIHVPVMTILRRANEAKKEAWISHTHLVPLLSLNVSCLMTLNTPLGTTRSSDLEYHIIYVRVYKMAHTNSDQVRQLYTLHAMSQDFLFGFFGWLWFYS